MAERPLSAIARSAVPKAIPTERFAIARKVETASLTSCTFSIRVRWAMPTLRNNKGCRLRFSQ